MPSPPAAAFQQFHNGFFAGGGAATDSSASTSTNTTEVHNHRDSPPRPEDVVRPVQTPEKSANHEDDTREAKRAKFVIWTLAILVVVAVVSGFSIGFVSGQTYARNSVEIESHGQSAGDGDTSSTATPDVPTPEVPTPDAPPADQNTIGHLHFIASKREDYAAQQDIHLTFEVRAGKRNWIAIAEAGSDVDGLLQTDDVIVDRTYACSEDGCEESEPSGEVVIGGGIVPPGTYQAYLCSWRNKPPYHIKASSEPFTVGTTTE